MAVERGRMSSIPRKKRFAAPGCSYIPGMIRFHPAPLRELLSQGKRAQAPFRDTGSTLRAQKRWRTYGLAGSMGNSALDHVQDDMRGSLSGSDIVRDSSREHDPPPLSATARTAWVISAVVALARLMRLRKGPGVIAALYPVGLSAGRNLSCPLAGLAVIRLTSVGLGPERHGNTAWRELSCSWRMGWQRAGAGWSVAALVRRRDGRSFAIT